VRGRAGEREQLVDLARIRGARAGLAGELL